MEDKKVIFEEIVEFVKSVYSITYNEIGDEFEFEISSSDRQIHKNEKSRFNKAKNSNGKPPNKTIIKSGLINLTKDYDDLLMGPLGNAPEEERKKYRANPREFFKNVLIEHMNNEGLLRRTLVETKNGTCESVIDDWLYYYDPTYRVKKSKTFDENIAECKKKLKEGNIGDAKELLENAKSQVMSEMKCKKYHFLNLELDVFWNLWETTDAYDEDDNEDYVNNHGTLEELLDDLFWYKLDDYNPDIHLEPEDSESDSGDFISLEDFLTFSSNNEHIN